MYGQRSRRERPDRDERHLKERRHERERGSRRPRDAYRRHDPFREERYYDRHEARHSRELPRRPEWLDRSRSRRGGQLRYQQDSRPRELPDRRRDFREKDVLQAGLEPVGSRHARSDSRVLLRGQRGRSGRKRRAASFARRETSLNGRAKANERTLPSSPEGSRPSAPVERHTVRLAGLAEKSKSPEKPEAAPVDKERLDTNSRDGFSVGELVKARYLSGSFYTATVEAFLLNGKILIAWADGDANDRRKTPEELRRCDEHGKILEEEKAETQDAQAGVEKKDEAEGACEDPQAKLTPAEREQAARIREFQRRRQERPEEPEPQEAKPKQQAAPLPTEKLDLGIYVLAPAAEEKQRMEDKLLMLSKQYLKLHEQITADTAATEKQMQDLLKSGAGQSALMTFRMEVMSKQSGQRLAALQIQEQIADLRMKLGMNPSESVEVALSEGTNPPQQMPVPMPVPPGPINPMLAAQPKMRPEGKVSTSDNFSPIQWRETLRNSGSSSGFHPAL